MLAAGAALAILMLRETVGPFDFLSSDVTTGAYRVGLWTTGDDRERERQRERWTARLAGRFVVEGVDSGPRRDSPLDLLIVDGVAVDRDGNARLRTFLEDGGSLGLFGVTAADGGSAHPLQALDVRGLVRPAADAYRWNLVREKKGAISAGMPRAGPLILRSARNIRAIETPDGEIRWAGAPGEVRRYAASYRRPENGGDGRLFWLAVRPDAALDRVDTQIAMGDLTRSAVAWLAGEPFAEVRHLARGSAGETASLQLRIRRRGPRRFILSISNIGEGDVSSVPTRIHLNRRVSAVDVGITSIGIGDAVRAPAPHLLPGYRTLDLEIPELRSGESRSYTLDLAPDAKVASTSVPSWASGENVR